MPVETYLRELADAEAGESNRTAFLRIEKQHGLPSIATLYRYVSENDCAEHARTVLDALDVKRAANGGLRTSIDDFRNLTAGKAA